MYLRQRFSFGPTKNLAITKASKTVPGRLHAAIGLLTSSLDGPACTVTFAVATYEVQFSKALTAAMPKDSPGVASRQLVTLDRLNPGAGRCSAEARHGIEQCKAHGVEQGGFSGARGAGDGENAGVAQGFGLKIDLEIAVQASQI